MGRRKSHYRHRRNHKGHKPYRKRRRHTRKARAAYLKRQRRRLTKKQKGRCADCGQRVTETPGRRRATVDHVIPLSRGGTDDKANLQVLCYACNQDKADRLPEEV